MQNPAYELRISDWRSDLCSSDRHRLPAAQHARRGASPRGPCRSGGVLMRRPLAAALALMLAGCGGSSDDFRNRPLAANPSAFIAAEIRFAQRAQEEGQWTAFRETAHPDAVMFVPERVKAPDWLKSQKDRKSVVKGKSVSVRVHIGGRRILKTKRTT